MFRLIQLDKFANFQELLYFPLQLFLIIIRVFPHFHAYTFQNFLNQIKKLIIVNKLPYVLSILKRYFHIRILLI